MNDPTFPELEERPGEPIKKRYWRVLNNFSNRFRTVKGAGQFRGAVEGMGTLNSTPRSLHTPRDDLSRYSLRYLDRTYAEFIADIDQAVLDAGLDQDKIAAAIQVWYGSGGKESDCETFYNLLFPVYLILRQQGYSHGDLWS